MYLNENIKDYKSIRNIFERTRILVIIVLWNRAMSLVELLNGGIYSSIL